MNAFDLRIPNSLDALYLSHGGGPLPLLGDDRHREMTGLLRAIATRITKPSAIIVISAHWEEKVATVTHGAQPSMIYDYYGFPSEAYEFRYAAPGAPELARNVAELLGGHGIESRLDNERGFDHGLYVPLMLMYPEADIPCIQVSLLDSLDSREHVRIGEALSGLAREGVLIIGSGFSFHNMRAFREPATPETKAMNAGFETWLIDTCSSQSISEPDRTERLVSWEIAPHARYCHPREEHLLPLHVCYGAVKRPCSAAFELPILGRQASFYLW